MFLFSSTVALLVLTIRLCLFEDSTQMEPGNSHRAGSVIAASGFTGIFWCMAVYWRRRSNSKRGPMQNARNPITSFLFQEVLFFGLTVCLLCINFVDSAQRGADNAGGISPIVIVGAVIAAGSISIVSCLAFYWHRRSSSKRYVSKKLTFATATQPGLYGPPSQRRHHPHNSSSSSGSRSRDFVVGNGNGKAMYSPTGGSMSRPPSTTEMTPFGRLNQNPGMSPSASSRSVSRSISSRLSKGSFSISFQTHSKGPSQRTHALEMSNMTTSEGSRTNTRERASSMDSVISTLSEVAEMSDSSMEGDHV